MVRGAGGKNWTKLSCAQARSLTYRFGRAVPAAVDEMTGRIVVDLPAESAG
jgi:hypothetical protein